MRKLLLSLVLIVSACCDGQQAAMQQSATAPTRTEFHIRYINGTNLYIDAGRNADLSEGMQLVLKQATNKQTADKDNAALEPGVIARVKVVSVATTSAVCEIESTTRELTDKDVLSLPNAEVEKIVEKHTLGNTRVYPMILSFTTGDPLDEEIRDAVPQPAIPEINQSRGRIGFDMSMIQGLGQGASRSAEYGLVLRADISRIHGTYWNLNGYWRGALMTGATTSQPTMQDLMNRTYQMSLTYVNPRSHWTAGVGRLYIPWANSLEVIDGGYVARKLTGSTTAGLFFCSTPDPTAWNYNPQQEIGGAFFNVHGGSFDKLYYTSTTGFGMNMLSWSINRPFVFTENDVSYKHNFSIYHSMQIDQPTANPTMPALKWGLGQSLLTIRYQVVPRVTLDLNHTYFRDVPTYSSTLLGTGLLDQYLFQGISGGARIEFPYHVTGYFTLGNSSTSTDKSSSMNMMFGASVSNIWKTGMRADVSYSKFSSSFAIGNYRTVTVSRNVGEKFMLNLQGGQQTYTSPLSSNSGNYFANIMVEANLGQRYFFQNAFTTQLGGTQDYNQWTSTFGIRFDNRAMARRAAHANHP